MGGGDLPDCLLYDANEPLVLRNTGNIRLRVPQWKYFRWQELEVSGKIPVDLDFSSLRSSRRFRAGFMK